MYVQAHRTFQAINFIEGKAPDSTKDPVNLFIPNFFETGLLPLAMPNREVAPNGSAAWTVRRFTYVVCIHIPFAVLDFCLSWLCANSNLIHSQGTPSEKLPAFNMQPFVMPAGIDSLGGELSYTDPERTTRLVWSFSDVKFRSDSPNKMARPMDMSLRECSLQAVEAASKEQERLIDSAISNSGKCE